MGQRDWAKDDIPDRLLDMAAREVSSVLGKADLRLPPQTLEAHNVGIRVLDRLCREFESAGIEQVPIPVLRDVIERMKLRPWQQ